MLYRTILLSIAATAVSVTTLHASNDLSLHDYSNRVSLTDTRAIATWDNSNDSFTSIDPRVTTRNRTSVPGWSTVLYEGEGCLEVRFPKGESADRWRAIRRTFSPALNLNGRTLIEYGILSAEGPGRDFITRLTLTGPMGRKYEARAHIIPTLWRGVIFDVSGCDFLNDIRAIEIALRNDGTEPWNNPVFYVDGLTAGRPFDLDFNLPGSSAMFTVSGKGHVSDSDGHLRYDFNRGSAIELLADTSHNMMYNPPLELRNTIRMALSNHSTADSIRLYFTTGTGRDFTPEQSKCAALPSRGNSGIVQFNLSDLPGASGHLRGLRIEPLHGNGTLNIDRVTFEREQPITTMAGHILSATATKDHVTVNGTVERQWLDSGAVTIEIRHCPLYAEGFPADSLELLGHCAFTPEFTISDIPNSRLGGKMTHLSSRLAAFLRLNDGRFIPVDRPFFIKNWRDFTTNPYAFDLPDRTYDVRDYGAHGNGYTDDTEALQNAIDAASQAGGGRVVLPTGGEYVATALRLRSNVNLVIEPGAVLRQSSRLTDYSYRPEYGHDNIIPGTPWTHCMYTNMPLILAKDEQNVKVTGGGTIRMEDTYTENPSWTHYAHNCSDRLHVVPMAFCNTRHIEISDIDILRADNYHTIFYRADSVFIGNLKMLEVACFSGDGISLGNASTNVRVDRCVFESNDDGIVIAASYKDPRGGGWRERVDTIDASIRNIEVLRSYIDSNRGGEGKAIAFIPWASTNPRLDHNEIDGITVHDCVLRGGHSVGTWPDNPFDGKPFDNCEVDDYSPIKNVDITGNEYLSKCDLMWVKPVSFVTDCGLRASSTLKNTDFADRAAYWTVTAGVDSSESHSMRLSAGATVSQSLWLTPGQYDITYSADNSLTVTPSSTFTVDTEGNYTIGFTAGQPTTLTGVTLTRH